MRVHRSPCSCAFLALLASCGWAPTPYLQGIALLTLSCTACSYWKKAIPLEELLAVNNEAERLAWTLQADSGERCSWPL